ncbi:MAG: hypothetical protein KA123_02510 [Candidatus Eisenbacteria bacterium]|nr:hypothetical protein [Candidatus Eisenbacteria bacterium]
MQWETLDEPIVVRADFRGGEITPLIFRRGQQRIRVSRVNTRWTDREGRRALHYFSVTAESGDVYQLCFDAGDLLWKAECVMYEG